MPGPRMATTQGMTMTTEPTARPGLYRLLAWLSPNFPIGAFSYSHGLEAACAGGTVCDAASLQGWIAAIIAQGSGRIDADILVEAYRAAEGGHFAALDAANRRGLAFRASAELALEAAQQGEAFLNTCRAAWPDAFLEEWAGSRNRFNPPPQAGEGRVGADAEAGKDGATPHKAGDRGKYPAHLDAYPSQAPTLTLPRLRGREEPGRQTAGEAEDGVCHSAVFGAVAARAGIALAEALTGYLEAFAANLVSAGLRLGIIGQTDGQRILAALEPVVADAASAATARDAADFGAATFAADLASMAHETQYMRLFRS
jgi:urease accessory protein